MALNIKPIAGTKNRIIVEPAPAETKTASGIIIPDTAKEKPLNGIVVAVGDDIVDSKPILKIGDNVIYGKHSGSELKWEGKNYLIMEENEVYGLIK